MTRDTSARPVGRKLLRYIRNKLTEIRLLITMAYDRPASGKVTSENNVVHPSREGIEEKENRGEINYYSPSSVSTSRKGFVRSFTSCTSNEG